MVESCLLCPHRGSCILGGQNRKVVQDFSGSLRRLTIQGKGRAVFHQGDLFSDYHLLCEGAVKLVKVLRGGEQVILDVLGPFSFLSLIPEQKESRHRCTAVTLTASSEIANLSEAQLNTLLKRHPQLGLAVARYFSERLGVTGRLLAAMRLPVRDRLLAYLAGKISLGEARGANKVIDLHLSYRDLAEIIQTTPETLSRTLRQLQDDGVLRARKGVFEIIQVELVSSYLEDNEPEEVGETHTRRRQ
jgi:CRP-like cAMP-binding protein